MKKNKFIRTSFPCFEDFLKEKISYFDEFCHKKVESRLNITECRWHSTINLPTLITFKNR